MSPGARLFFAIRPAPPVREALSRVARHWARHQGGRPVSPGRIHLTLQFLGPVPAAQVAGLREAAGRVRAEPFGLTLEVVGAFERVGVGWAGLRELPAALLALQAQLARAAAEAGCAVDGRLYVPHVTLVRGLGRARAKLPSVGPLYWPVRRFSLIASVAGQQGYECLGSWRLGARPAPFRGP